MCLGSPYNLISIVKPVSNKCFTLFTNQEVKVEERLEMC